jgi:hypothetical protein
MEEISATIGIDMNTATPEEVAKRAYEFALEMADCYEPGTLEYSAFEALAIAIQMVRGGK